MEKEVTIPAWGGNCYPYRLIARDTDKWSVTIEEINGRSYDSTKLFRSSLNIDVGIAPYSLIVLFDGTMVVPRCSDISHAKALAIFNKHLTKLFLGGLFSGEVSPDDVTEGCMNLWGYHRHLCPTGRYSKLSQALRVCTADPIDSILLMGLQPLTIQQYHSHYKMGSAISNVLPENFSSVFLPSYTSFCNEEWERALILGWSSVELLISGIWESQVVANTCVQGIKQKRRKDFLSDTRTWTSSARIEMLWQKGCIDDDLYALLDKGRSARNVFIHSAAQCSPDESRGVIKSILLLIECVVRGREFHFDAAALMRQLDEKTRRYRSPVADENGRLLNEPKFWRHLDPAPGFADWKDRPFEKIPDIQLLPISHEFNPTTKSIDGHRS